LNAFHYLPHDTRSRICAELETLQKVFYNNGYGGSHKTKYD
jgi:hypothetical protein